MATYKLVGALSANGTKLYAPTSADTGRVVGDLSIALGASLALTSGNVGIGIAHAGADGKLHVHVATAGTVTAAAAADDFVVEGSGNSGMSILVPDANDSKFSFGSPSLADGASHIWNYNANEYVIRTGRVGATVILRAGNEITNLTLSGASGSELATFAGNVTAVKGMTTWNATAIPAGGTAGSGYKFSSTSNFGVFFGSGAPSLSAAKGSLYLRSDGSGVADRGYINTDGGTTWTAIATAA